MIHHQIIIILYDYNVDDDVAGVPVPVPTLTLHPLHLSILPQVGVLAETSWHQVSGKKSGPLPWKLHHPSITCLTLLEIVYMVPTIVSSAWCCSAGGRLGLCREHCSQLASRPGQLEIILYNTHSSSDKLSVTHFSFKSHSWFL